MTLQVVPGSKLVAFVKNNNNNNNIKKKHVSTSKSNQNMTRNDAFIVSRNQSKLSGKKNEKQTKYLCKINNC
jgi:hypothetical protein